MRKEHLHILIANSSRKWIGEAAHTLLLCRRYIQRGHQVWLACRRGKELEHRAHSIDNLHVIPLNFWSRFHPLYDLGDMLHLRRIILSHNIDIMHVHRGKEHWLGAMTLLSLRHHRPRLVRTRHVVVPMKQHIFNKWLFHKGTDGIISVSLPAKTSMGALIQHISPERSPVIHSAVDRSIFSPEKRSETLRNRLGVGTDQILIGLIARFQKVKGQIPFLHAARKLLDDSSLKGKVKFLLAGRDAQHFKYKFEHLTESPGLHNEVLLLENVEDIPELLASLDIGVVASLGSEGWSRITMEYMASGVPVVASRVGGIPELIQHEQTGLLIEPGNIEEMASAIQRLIDAPELQALLVKNSLAYCTMHLDPDRFINDMLNFYYTLLEEKQ